MKKRNKKDKKIVCVFGVWHLGAVNAVGFAEKGYQVLGVELDSKKVKTLNQGKPPLHEPGLAEAMTKQIKMKKLSFTDDVSLAAESDFVVIAYDSPVNDRDEVDTVPVFEAAKKVAEYLKATTPVVITSQIPLGTSEKIEELIRLKNKNWKSGVIYTPENLRLGNALKLFLEPDMLILGANDSAAGAVALELYRPFKTEKIFMDLRSAEMVKHALNTFLATSITFINEIANLSDRLGADAVKVGEALRLDKRIGPRALLIPGLGFSGGTLARDVTQLKHFATKVNYDATLLDSILKVNEGTFDQIIWKLRKQLGNLKDCRIGILGLTYKPGTSTIRRSPALKIIQKLKDVDATCVGYDPMASDEEMVGCEGLFTRVSKPMELFKGSDALVLVTEWPEFKDLPFGKLARSMKTPLFIDSKNFLDPEKMTGFGFEYVGFGRIGRNG